MLNLKLKQNVYRQRKLREMDGEAIQKLTEIGQDLKSLINTDTVFDESERLLDNQDLAFLLKASFRTLQRYRAKGALPYFTIGRKTYYRASDIRAFVREYADSQTYKQFEKANQLANQP